MPKKCETRKRPSRLWHWSLLRPLRLRQSRTLTPLILVRIQVPQPRILPTLDKVRHARDKVGLSLSRPASGVAIITGSGERDGWLMAVGIDLGDSR